MRKRTLAGSILIAGVVLAAGGAVALNKVLQAIAQRNGEGTADVDAMQPEYPR